MKIIVYTNSLLQQYAIPHQKKTSLNNSICNLVDLCIQYEVQMNLFRRLLLPFKSYKFLLYQLSQKEIKARYKQSFVGYAWVIVNPLAQLLVYTFVFSMIFRTVSIDVPYPLFVFAVLIPWTFLHTGITSATNSLVANRELLKKVAFPREVIPYASVFSKVVDLVFSYLVFFLFMIFYSVPLTWSIFLFIPLFISQFILTTAIALLTSAANLFYRDVQYLINLILMLWMYVTPIVYPLSMVPEKYLTLYKLNPMVGLIEGYRAAFFGSEVSFSDIGWSLLSSVVLFVVAYAFFKKVEPIFADIV